MAVGAGFEAVFLDPVGQVVQQRWADAAVAVAFEELDPVSAFPVVPGRRWGPGLWWSATTGRHVASGSQAMRVQLMVLDRDYKVVGLAGRPVRILWRDGRGRGAEHGIRLHHRTYDHDLLGPHRGQPSNVAARGGKWEVHANPHDVRQIWVRLPGLGLTEIPWIHREHAHQPFNDRTWQYLRTTTAHRAGADAERAEADLAEALDQLMRRALAGQATAQEQHLLARTTTIRTPPPPRSRPGVQVQELDSAATGVGEDSIDDLDRDGEDTAEGEDQAVDGPAVPVAGYGLYDAQEEALKW
ncbi:hypothetical protein ACFV8T_44830 [Streptomyces sp. NPDC059832]|uniref:hypothetical protein n=1 Tax=unclassified Streptomyces TaxID=2593676 RepID=UPI0036689CAA